MVFKRNIDRLPIIPADANGVGVVWPRPSLAATCPDASTTRCRLTAGNETTNSRPGASTGSAPVGTAHRNRCLSS
jgi:hypothetical protein